MGVVAQSGDPWESGRVPNRPQSIARGLVGARCEARCQSGSAEIVWTTIVYSCWRGIAKCRFHCWWQWRLCLDDSFVFSPQTWLLATFSCSLCSFQVQMGPPLLIKLPHLVAFAFQHNVICSSRAMLNAWSSLQMHLPNMFVEGNWCD